MNKCEQTDKRFLVRDRNASRHADFPSVIEVGRRQVTSVLPTARAESTDSLGTETSQIVFADPKLLQANILDADPESAEARTSAPIGYFSVPN